MQSNKFEEFHNKGFKTLIRHFKELAIKNSVYNMDKKNWSNRRNLYKLQKEYKIIRMEKSSLFFVLNSASLLVWISVWVVSEQKLQLIAILQGTATFLVEIVPFAYKSDKKVPNIHFFEIPNL